MHKYSENFEFLYQIRDIRELIVVVCCVYNCQIKSNARDSSSLYLIQIDFCPLVLFCLFFYFTRILMFFPLNDSSVQFGSVFHIDLIFNIIISYSTKQSKNPNLIPCVCDCLFYIFSNIPPLSLSFYVCLSDIIIFMMLFRIFCFIESLQNNKMEKNQKNQSRWSRNSSFFLNIM